LVDAHYRQDYQIWKQRLDANIRASSLFSWSLEGSFWHCCFLSIHRSSSEYSFWRVHGVNPQSPLKV
jgi:hypothetical protein